VVRANGPRGAPDPLNETDDAVFAPDADEPDPGETPPVRGSRGSVGQANSVPLQAAEASGASKQRRKQKASALQGADDAGSLEIADFDKRLNDILLTYIAEALPLTRSSSPTSTRTAPTGRRSLARGQDSIPAVRDVLRAMLTSKRNFVDVDGEKDGLACDQCPKRVKRACDMK
jgi:hypothetical protein